MDLPINNQLLSNLSVQSNKFELSINPLLRKQTGSYYTDINLTLAMVGELLNSLHCDDLYNKKFLEPCVGTGNFVYAYLYWCSKKGYTKEQAYTLFNNIYVCDINTNALSIYKENLRTIAVEWFDIEIGDDYFGTHIGGGLLFNVNESNVQYRQLTDVFSPEVVGQGFDIVVTNPPYKNLKAERGQYSNDDVFSIDKEKYSTIGDIATRYFKYSMSGILNLYKLFVEEITERYLALNGSCSLLIPSSFFSDKTCSKLRTRILDTCEIQSIRLLAETSPFVLSSQALCAVQYKKGAKTSRIRVDGAFGGDLKQGAYVDIKDILDEETGNAILVLSEQEYSIRAKMRSFPRIRELSYIKNLRGELDLSLNKKYITNIPNKYRLYRGRNIGYYSLVETDEEEYVDEEFVFNSAKKSYIESTRLVCQQVVNMAKKRRIAFTIMPQGCVLGNSCNFISVAPNNDGVSIYFLLGVLNSSLIDWYFKLTSSNNHINNYEIDDFPIPVNYPRKAEIESKVLEYLGTKNEDILLIIDKLVYDAYGLIECQEDKSEIFNAVNCSEVNIFSDRKALIRAFHNDLQKMMPEASYDDCERIINGKLTITELCFRKEWEGGPFEREVLDNIEKKYKGLADNLVLNHTTFKLSDLDLEMIRPVPQGGSWRDIPQEVVNKSKRLKRITETGGRTTLYGRIDYSKPSYTITTYFNRPGNGTYVHPDYDRVLSVREAARFQSFPDDYYFCGNKTDMLKQVGNAVPVLLAYSIGKTIKDKTGCNVSVDLFSGAGGMTLGFKMAGIKAVIANDIEKAACTTLKCNSPEIPVLCGDITDEAVKQKIVQAGKQANADIICGGPPCQGFSLAGFRRADDPRNQLFRHFVDIVSAINPKIIVFENVEGLLSFKGGETYNNIIELFSGLGYNTEGRMLLANHYGVPQRRKRVVILCTRKDLPYKPSELYPQTLTEATEKQITAFDVLHDLIKVECGEGAKYIPGELSLIAQYFKREITVSEYIDLIK